LSGEFVRAGIARSEGAGGVSERLRLRGKQIRPGWW
jgi:hypothetical protein